MPRTTTAAKPRRAAKSTPAAGVGGQPAAKLLAGGNPQIEKGYGQAKVDEFIAAAPGWKAEVARQIDGLISAAVPEVAKAVKWNSPLYGTGDDHWFLGLHYMTRYVKVSFFRGAELTPPPPGPSRQPLVRYLDIHEDQPIDVAQFTDWVKQAHRLPGEKM